MVETRRKNYQPKPTVTKQKPSELIKKPTVNQKKPENPSTKVSSDPKSDKEKIWTEKLTRLYEDISSAPSYSAKITDFLRQNETHSLHRRIIKKVFPRRKVISRFPFENFMADLIEYPRFGFHNRGYKFILLMIDCFTKMLYAVPMKKKSKEWASEAFEKIFSQFDQFPINLITDNGLEFYNSSVQKIFQAYGINHFSYKTQTKWKASMIERANRTLKSRFEKIFHLNKKPNWIDFLDQLVTNYNKTPHSAHKLPPLEVTDENRDVVFKRMFPNQGITVVCKLKEKDKVRKIKEKTLFEKGYSINWSEQIFKIKSIRQSNGVCWYKIESLDGKEEPGIFYYYQLNLVARNDNKSGRESDKK